MSNKSGRVAVITGASSGIGKETAKALAAQGWTVIGTGRNKERLASAKSEIRAVSATPDKVTMIQADFALLKEAEACASQIAKLTDRIDVLINNAGGMTTELVMTEEGLEANFTGNHLGPFVLTDRLLPLLRKANESGPSGGVRILMTSSDANQYVPAIDLNDIQGLARGDAGLLYCLGKLANIMFTRALAKRLEGEGIMVNSVHPGTVDSNFYSYATPETRARLEGQPKLTSEAGADTLIWLATSEEGGRSTGGYWHERKLGAANPLADDEALVESYWQASKKLIEPIVPLTL